MSDHALKESMSCCVHGVIQLGLFYTWLCVLFVGVKKGAGKERGILSEAQHRAYLDRHPYREYQPEELEYAK